MAENENREQINTYVFLDLETTGLPHERPLITEVGLVSAQRNEILAKYTAIHGRGAVLTNLLPRVLNKMNICLYPNGVPLSKRITEITGLSDENLQGQRPFDIQTYNTIMWFIERLPTPVCIIAHNGRRFDFPILQSELRKLGQNLPRTVYYADTLPCFRNLLIGQNDNRLETIYRMLTGRELERQHVAESDAVGLLECAVVLGERFIQWIDENKERFD